MTAWSGTPRKTWRCMLEEVDDAGVRARGKHHQPLVPDVHREESLIHDQGIGLPLPVVGKRHVAGESGLVGSDAGDFAACVESARRG